MYKLDKTETNMQAINHNSYQAYVAHNAKLGYSVIPESLYNGLKEQDEMYNRFKTDMIATVEMKDNLNEDGSINWNYVDADMYMTWSVVLDGEQYTAWFDEAANEIEGATV